MSSDHVKELVCLDGDSKYHELECEHLVETAENSKCYLNCKNNFDLYPTELDYELDTWDKGTITCAQCLRDKIYDRDILPAMTPRLQSLYNSPSYKLASDKKRQDMVSEMMKLFEFTRRWDEATEREIRLKADIIGRPVSAVPTAQDALVSLLEDWSTGSPVRGGKTGSKSAAVDSGRMEVPMRDVLPPVLPLGGTNVSFNDTNLFPNELRDDAMEVDVIEDDDKLVEHMEEDMEL